jgi:putative spermidine/putrescine transport system substrate-binding protein
MKLKPVLMAVAMLASLPALAQSQLTVVNFGGANGAAQKKAYFEPYEKASGGKVVQVEYNGEQARIKAMVEAKKVTWDVVEVESPDLSRGCDEGLFEKMDWAKVGNKADFQKAAVHECGVGTFVWSTVMAYDGDKLKTAPTTWADFWDVKKFPGQARSAQRRPLQPRIRADGRRRQAGRRVQGAGHQRRCRARLQEADRAQAQHPVVGSRRAAAAVPGRR